MSTMSKSAAGELSLKKKVEELENKTLKFLVKEYIVPVEAQYGNTIGYIGHLDIEYDYPGNIVAIIPIIAYQQGDGNRVAIIGINGNFIRINAASSNNYVARVLYIYY